MTMRRLLSEADVEIGSSKRPHRMMRARAFHRLVMASFGPFLSDAS